MIREFENDIINVDDILDKVDTWKFLFNNNVKIMEKEKDFFTEKDIKNEKIKIKKLEKMTKLLKQLEDLQSYLY